MSRGTPIRATTPTATTTRAATPAGRLQNQHQETLSATQIESVGQEVGLEPTFIRKALAQLTPAQSRTISRMPSTTREFYTVLFAFLFPALYGGFTYGWRGDPGA